MDQIFQNGERFRGYVVERLLGNGGLGAVYLVRHELMDRLRSEEHTSELQSR